MASSSQPAFLPPSVGGPSNRLKEYTKLLVESAQTSLITKFERYMEEHPLRPGQDKRDRISTFITSVDDKQERTKALHFLLEHYEDADYTRTGRWLQCAYCKKWHTRHNTLPMIPASDIDNWHCAHVNLCHACLMASHDDQLLHPGEWLRTERTSEELNEPLPPLPQGTPDLTQTRNRPAALQSLDRENNKEHWQPHHWTIAIPSEATQTWHGFIVHAWNSDQQRWVRSPIANPHSDNYDTPNPFNITTLTKISGKAWHTRLQYSQLEFTQRPRMAVYQQLREQARRQNPDASNTYLRTITCQQLLFISQWSSNSVYNMDPKQREQFLTALSQWHEAQAEQAFTGENPIRHYLESKAYTDHLKQFWDAITPTLYHHFLCRSPLCKLVVMNSHWLRTMAPGSAQQGSYLCPHCLETYRPFSNTSYNKNIGQLVQAKQCLVVKVPKNIPPMLHSLEDNNWHRTTRNTLTTVSYGMARKGYRAIHGTTQTDHRQPPPGIPRRRRQGSIPPRTNPPTHPEDTETTLHATGLLDPTQHRRHQRPELAIRIQQVQAPIPTTTMGQPPGQKDLLLRLLPIQM